MAIVRIQFSSLQQPEVSLDMVCRPLWNRPRSYGHYRDFAPARKTWICRPWEMVYRDRFADPVDLSSFIPVKKADPGLDRLYGNSNY
jgi:hypothetical protein